MRHALPLSADQASWIRAATTHGVVRQAGSGKLLDLCCDSRDNSRGGLSSERLDDLGGTIEVWSEHRWVKATVPLATFLFVSQGVGLLAVAILLASLRRPLPGDERLLLSLAAGAFVVTRLSLLYMALAGRSSPTPPAACPPRLRALHGLNASP